MIRTNNALQKLKQVVVLLLFSYFGFWWIYELDILPGLHGDEAWFGLKAHLYMLNGVDSLHGMNSYTGIFQPLACIAFFKAAGLGVLQLRAAGVFFNMLALLLTYGAFRLRRDGVGFIIFLLIFSQSALYLVTPRVAWEVNTFTFFFLSLLVIAVIRIMSDISVFSPLWSGLFLMVNLLGTYNHIIFSCLSVAILVATILWSIYNNTRCLRHVIILLILNLVNLLELFVAMRHWLDISFLNDPFIFLLILTAVVILEVTMLGVLSKIRLPEFALPKMNAYIIYVLLVALLIIFLRYHGLALYQVFSNYKIITHAYSYEIPLVGRIVFLMGGGVFCFYFFLFLVRDIKNKKDSLFAMFIIAYLGILPLYVTSCSFRYYLCIYIVISLYLAVKASLNIRSAIPLIVSMICMALAVNVSLFRIFNASGRNLHAIHVSVGNGNQIENSGHFLPNKPLIDFLKINKIGRMECLSERYFFEQPVRFYNLIDPWEKFPGNAAMIDYEYSENETGGYMLVKEK